MLIRVNETPAGDAPEAYRKSWVGTIFEIEPNDIFEPGQGTPEVSIRGNPQIPRKYFAVDSRTALRLLSLNSLEAVGHFVSTWSEQMYYERIHFGWDEVEVLPENDESENAYLRQFGLLEKRIIRDAPRK